MAKWPNDHRTPKSDYFTVLNYVQPLIYIWSSQSSTVHGWVALSFLVRLSRYGHISSFSFSSSSFFGRSHHPHHPLHPRQPRYPCQPYEPCHAQLQPSIAQYSPLLHSTAHYSTVQPNYFPILASRTFLEQFVLAFFIIQSDMSIVVKCWEKGYLLIWFLVHTYPEKNYDLNHQRGTNSLHSYS